MQFIWVEFLKAWNGDYDRNPFPKYTYMYVYYEIFIKPLFANKINNYPTIFYSLLFENPTEFTEPIIESYKMFNEI